MDPAILRLPVKMKLKAKVSTLPSMRLLSALLIEREWESATRKNMLSPRLSLKLRTVHAEFNPGCFVRQSIGAGIRDPRGVILGNGTQFMPNLDCCRQSDAAPEADIPGHDRPPRLRQNFPRRSGTIAHN
jgi:hypothetical protein